MKYLPKNEQEVKNWLKDFVIFYISYPDLYYTYLKIDRHAYADYPCRELSEKIILKSLKNIVNVIRNYKEEKENSYIIYSEDSDFLDGQIKELELISFNIFTEAFKMSLLLFDSFHDVQCVFE
jgi:hypothetical protein